MAKKGKHRKKKKSGNKIALILLFISTFLITLFVISGVLSTYSPPVDVNIGDGEFIENTAMVDEAEDYEDLEHADVDSRLKWIQYEDNMTSEEFEEEKQAKKIVKPEEQSVNKQVINEIKKASKKAAAQSSARAPLPKSNAYNLADSDVIAAPPIPTVKEIKHKTTARVYVGYYPTLEQAMHAKNLISAEVPGYQPYVKNVNGQYIVQVANFSDVSTAVQFKLDLSDKGFPARLQTEH